MIPHTKGALDQCPRHGKMRKIHETKDNICKYFQKGNCIYDESECWFNHVENFIPSLQDYSKIECIYCGQEFKNKDELI